MADAAARREARRRRILENSENRLQRITGSNKVVQEDKSSNSLAPSNTGAANPEPEFVPDTNVNSEPTERENNIFDEPYWEEEDLSIGYPALKHLRKRNNAPESLSADDTAGLRNHSLRNERFSPNERQSSSVNKATNESDQDVNPHDSIRRVSTQTPLSYTVFESKWILVLLAALVNVLYILQLQHLYGKTVLWPFFALMLVRLRLDDKSGGQGGSMLSAALILCNVKPELVYNIRWVMRILKKITEEFGIYIFSFVIFYNIACSYWNDIDVSLSSIDSPKSGKLE